MPSVSMGARSTFLDDDEPPIRLTKALNAAGVDSKAFRTLKHGETWPDVLPN